MADDEGVVKKTRAKKKVVAADDDDAPVVRTSKKAVVAAGDDDTPIVKKAARHADPTGSAAAPAAASATAASAQQGSSTGGADALFPRHDYDSMSYDAFIKLLKGKTKKERVQEKLAHDDYLVEQQKAKEAGPQVERFTDLSGGYTYKELLEKAFSTIREKNKDKEDGGRARLPRPKVEKQGSKRTALMNFREMCDALQRPMEDIKDFFEKQLTTQSSIDQGGRLIVKIQNVKENQIESLFAEYINEFVKCNMCHSLESSLVKDNNRLFLLTCNKCGAGRSVAPAQGAQFQAQTGKRSRMRQAQLT